MKMQLQQKRVSWCIATCKPVELYNILHRRAIHNPSFLRRCLRFKIQARHKRNKRLRAGIVIFNYRDRNNVHQKVEDWFALSPFLYKSILSTLSATPNQHPPSLCSICPKLLRK